MKKLKELTREEKAKLNIITSLLAQVSTLLCGFVIPRLMISYYGSEAYGAVSSISQFLGYITLFEGGVCGVARAALYKPLAEENYYRVGQITKETSIFFKRIAYFFLIYVLCLASMFKYISQVECFDFISTFLLVIAISISTIAQYLFGITNFVFLQAAQKAYITNIATIFTIITNTVITIILVSFGFNIIVVKLVSSIVFVAKPVVYSLYIKKNYSIPATKRDPSVLSQKWDALGQHIAYFLHSNTDIVILTIFSGLKSVAVYSVYNMIISSLQNLVYSFSNGMEALFGDMQAKNELSLLRKRFNYFSTLLSIISILLFSVAAVLIVPFVKLYTRGFSDANYTQPFFAVVLSIAACIFCCRLPYHAIIISSGRFRQTRWGSYGEAIINITSSVLLVKFLGLTGVAIGTVLACAFRFIYYAIYLKNHIIKTSLLIFIKRNIVNIVSFCLVLFVGSFLISKYTISSYFEWIVVAVVICLVSSFIVGLVNLFFFKDETTEVFQSILGRFFRRN